MLAIAGSKGGCGKSTVTLGLAGAFARADTPAIAIDADRQLPNLHVMTDVDRTPTVADLGDRGLVELAQEYPQQPGVGIVPAPKSSQAFDFETLEDIESDGFQFLLDCPSGAGPDAVDPLGRATGVIVVASDTERSLEAAETTIEMARRLGTPIYGAIFNRCTDVPNPATAWTGVPLLGSVPERPSPLLNDDVESAFDDIVERLHTQSAADRAPPEYAGNRLPLGTDTLDYRLGGGLPPGSVIALVAPPASQAEHLLYRATGVRGTLYLTTERSRTNVRRAIATAETGGGTPTIRHIHGDGALEDALSFAEKLPDAANLIVDPIDPLERRSRSEYVHFLEELKDRIVETGGLAILHCFADGLAGRSATLRAADAVFEFESVAPGAGTDTEHYLSVPKYRPMADFSETVELDFSSNGPGPIEPPAHSD